jgi:hypothetical protein
MADKKKAVRPKVYNIIVDGEPFVGRTALINRVCIAPSLPSPPSKMPLPDKSNP